METKICRSCKENKTVEHFSPKQGTCKDCRNKRKRELYKQHGIHPVNYKTYEGGKVKPEKINLSNEQYTEFHKIRTSKSPLFTVRETLHIMELI